MRATLLLLAMTACLQAVSSSHEAMLGQDYKALPLQAASALAASAPSVAIDAISFDVMLKGLTQATFTTAERAKYLAALKRVAPGNTFRVIGTEEEDEGVGAYTEVLFPAGATLTPESLHTLLTSNLTGLVPKSYNPHLESVTLPYVITPAGKAVAAGVPGTKSGLQIAMGLWDKPIGWFTVAQQAAWVASIKKAAGSAAPVTVYVSKTYDPGYIGADGTPHPDKDIINTLVQS